ncbi:hypothetical protein GCM10027040_29390 [Halomonas shantousis]
MNLVSSIGEANGDHINMRYRMVASVDTFQYGQCQSKMSFSERRFEPRPGIRGDIARTYWYIRDTYDVSISRQQQQLSEAWAVADPVNDWERLHNRRIAAIQGHGNPYIETDATPAPMPTPAANDPVIAPAASGTSVCGTKKTCGAMTSCAEAHFYLEQCGIRRLDGDGDGVPCESICSR